ncbi:MAG: amidohydrolase [Gammaproteobacteria bacterium]|nr:amidohydrolase [Gammaproteobacteria bacterium]
MRAVIAALTTCLALSAAPASPAAGAPAAADIVFTGGAVYTLDAARRWAGAVAVRDGKIVFVGDDDGAKPFVGPRTRLIPLGGRMLLPSFQDSHSHPSQVPDPANELDLDGLQDREQVFARIRGFAAAHPRKAWIVGGGWDEAAFLPSGRPTRQMLDALVPDRPVFLINNSRHQAWVNSAALAAAGVTRDTPDPANGEIVRDAAGDPTGNLQETAMSLVRDKLPPRSLEERAEDLLAALRQMNAQGITAMVEAAADPATVAAYEALQRSGRLTTRARLCQRFDPDDPDDEAQIRRFVATRERVAAAGRGGDLDAGCVKVILDGGYGSRSVALLKPYAIPGLGTGRLFVGPQRLDRLVTRLDALGFQVHVHAIGDRTVRAALDAIEVARKTNPSRGPPHTLAHLSLVDLADAPRFRQLGVMPNMTPLWSRPDPWQTVFAVQMFGRERADTSYRTRSLAEDGAELVWGSDWPVTGVATLVGIETAVTHRYPGGRDPSGAEDQPWNPDQRLSLDRALAAYTATAAALFGESARRGSIEVGKDADLVVLGRDLFETPQGAIHEVPVQLTLRQGRVLWSDPKSGLASGL